MVEETQLFQRKLHKLIEIWAKLLEFNANQKNQLVTLKRKASAILKQVEKDESLNAGGRFEWVDSILIKVHI